MTKNLNKNIKNLRTEIAPVLTTLVTQLMKVIIINKLGTQVETCVGLVDFQMALFITFLTNCPFWSEKV